MYQLCMLFFKMSLIRIKRKDIHNILSIYMYIYIYIYIHYKYNIYIQIFERKHIF